MQSIDSGTIHSKVKITGTMVFFVDKNGMIYIAKQERVLNLWRGLTPALIGSLPSTVLYYTGYEALRDLFILHTQSSYSPLFAGAIARSMVVGVISPLELFRTRMQADNVQFSAITKDVRIMIEKNGMRSLWRGLGSTILRDAPFSAIYWLSIENLRQNIHKKYPIRSYSQDLGISFFTGSFAGLIAGVITHPFDVTKTVLQVTSNDTLTIRSVFKELIRNEGAIGLYTGLIPRLAKVVPSCGIMISCKFV
jgi:solute carrier family 25 protein 39/40